MERHHVEVDAQAKPPVGQFQEAVEEPVAGVHRRADLERSADEGGLLPTGDRRGEVVDPGGALRGRSIGRPGEQQVGAEEAADGASEQQQVTGSGAGARMRRRRAEHADGAPDDAVHTPPGSRGQSPRPAPQARTPAR
jgi:hypothetical protein